jgi:hypothetical protein
VRTELASGAWVEMRSPEELNAKDKAVMQDATELSVNWMTPGASTMSLGAMTRQHHAVMARIVTKWSFPYMLPAEDPSEDENGCKTYEASVMYLPIDDYNELLELLQPYLAKLNGGGPKARTVTTSGSNGSSRARASSPRASRPAG